ncbi:MAG: hypothetical protein FWG90_01820 [Oscillospiraceae bacterium]|nr:hypothetical protein [Oscillospiraceae bacterium]
MNKISVDYLYQQAMDFIIEMLLHDELRLKDIPTDLRVTAPSVYTTALRISRGISCRRYVKDITILCDDILILSKNFEYRKRLLEKLEHSLTLHNYEKDEYFVSYKEDIPKEILSELQEMRGIRGEIIRSELGNF